MFTGIVQGTRLVEKIHDVTGRRRLKIRLDDFMKDLHRGASVAVNGTCLTVVALDERCAEFDVIQESLKRTNLGALKEGDSVNIERACRYGDEVGGHQVTGHIDTTGWVKQVHHSENNCELIIECGVEWIKFLVPKGWIALDGVSLTVVDVYDYSFSVCLIPETLQQTILGRHLQGGEAVNLEFDHTTKVIVQTIERILSQQKFRLF